MKEIVFDVIETSDKKRELKTAVVEDERGAMVDIRWFYLYGGNHDGIKKYTKKGVRFLPINIPHIIISLFKIGIMYGVRFSQKQKDEISELLSKVK